MTPAARPTQMVFFHFRVTVGPAERITNTTVASAAGAKPVSDMALASPVPVEALVIGKTHENLNGQPLYEGDTTGYIIGIANLDALTHTGVIVTDASRRSPSRLASRRPTPSTRPTTRTGSSSTC